MPLMTQPTERASDVAIDDDGNYHQAKNVTSTALHGRHTSLVSENDVKNAKNNFVNSII